MQLFEKKIVHVTDAALCLPPSLWALGAYAPYAFCAPPPDLPLTTLWSCITVHFINIDIYYVSSDSIVSSPS